MSVEFNPEQSQQNIKILKDLEEQKRRIRQTTTTASTSSTSTITQSNLLDNSQQTIAVKPPPTNISFFNTNTFGYFISTDSPYGNTIIPILPRFKDV